MSALHEAVMEQIRDAGGWMMRGPLCDALADTADYSVVAHALRELRAQKKVILRNARYGLEYGLPGSAVPAEVRAEFKPSFPTPLRAPLATLSTVRAAPTAPRMEQAPLAQVVAQHKKPAADVAKAAAVLKAAAAKVAKPKQAKPQPLPAPERRVYPALEGHTAKLRGAITAHLGQHAEADADTLAAVCRIGRRGMNYHLRAMYQAGELLSIARSRKHYYRLPGSPNTAPAGSTPGVPLQVSDVNPADQAAVSKNGVSSPDVQPPAAAISSAVIEPEPSAAVPGAGALTPAPGADVITIHIARAAVWSDGELVLHDCAGQRYSFPPASTRVLAGYLNHLTEIPT